MTIKLLRENLVKLRMTELIKRIITVSIILSLLSLLFIYGTNSLFLIIIYLVTAFSFYEWLRLTSKSIYYMIPFIILLSVVDNYNFIPIDMFIMVFILFIIIMIYLTFYHQQFLRDKIKSYSLLLGTSLIFSLFFFLINLYPIDNTLLRDTSLIDNKHYFIILITLVSLIDISAYLTGKIIGRNKIPSLVSPNKTYEGYVGSLLLTVLAFISASNYFEFQWTSLDLMILFIFILLAFYGDFLMSLIKRIFNAKDTGSILPGHGGLLDRMDSYFTTLPIFHVWFLL